MPRLSLLIARQRSGTGALGSVVGAHPDAHYAGEVFHPANVGRDDNFFTFLAGRVRDAAEDALPDRRLPAFEAFVEACAARHGGRMLMIDVKYRSLRHLDGGWTGLVERPRILDFALRNDVPVVHLTRRNAVETFVSGRLAEANRVWHARPEAELAVRSTVVNVRELSHYIAHSVRETALVEEWLRPLRRVVTLDYAELFDADGALAGPVAEALAGTLGLAPFGRRAPAFVKQAPPRLDDAIENADLVRQALSGTPHAWMLP